jgi:hypothetical protein
MGIHHHAFTPARVSRPHTARTTTTAAAIVQSSPTTKS